MIEKFFIVDDNSQLAKDYWNWKKNLHDVNEHVKLFMEENQISATQYHADNNILYIIPTKEDIERYDKILGKDIGNGLRPFKKNSTIHKLWIKSLKDNNLTVLHKPHTVWYFKEFAGGRFSTRLFDVDGVIYTSFSWEGNKLDCPEGFTEIKASEFWKGIEKNESN